MSAMHHPSDELLLSYAAGATDEAISLVLATHLALCPRCRKTLEKAEAAGGMLLENGEAAPMAEKALRSVMARLDEPVVNSATVSRVSTDVPEPLYSYIGGDLNAVRWTKIAGGISFKPLFRRNNHRVQLIRSRAGSGVALHTHGGEELTLCLAGGYSDNTGTYARGDLQMTTPDNLHRPVADLGEDCIVLAVSEGSLRFSNPLMGAIGKWFGF
jgi:putative transcriptional regulator